jgi:hypothetical protein
MYYAPQYALVLLRIVVVEGAWPKGSWLPPDSAALSLWYRFDVPVW